MTRSSPGPALPERAERPHVIVAGCRHGGLATMRALGPLGFRITALGPHPEAFGARSRHVSERVTCPDPSDHDAFIEFLEDRAEAWAGALILETEDVYTEVLSRHRDRLGERYHVLAPPWEVARWFLHKDRTAELARACGVPHPRTLSAAAAAVAPPMLPAMVKPVRSHLFVAAFGVKLWVFDDVDSLRAGLARAAARGIEVVVQEVVPGFEAWALESVEVYINQDGSLGAHQCNVKLRQAPPKFGVMRAGRSVPIREDTLDAALRLLRHVGFTGFASVEFKRDPRDGSAKLIEVNARMPRNAALLLRSGTNFPREIHDDVVRGIPSRPGPTHSAWFVDAASDVAEFLRGDRRALRHPVDLLGPYVGRRRSSAVFSVRDPGPALAWFADKVTKRGARRQA